MPKTKNENIWTACASGNGAALAKMLRTYKLKVDGKAQIRHLRDNHNWTPLFHAVTSGSIKCVELILNNSTINSISKDYEGNIALHFACEKAELDMLELLLMSNPDSVNIKNGFSMSPLHYAVRANRSIDIIDFLCVKGAVIDALDYTKESPLFIALENGNVELVIYLLYAAQANPLILNENEINCMETFLYRCDGDINRKITCFKILYNFMNKDQEWRPKYWLKDILKYAVLSSRSQLSLIPYFFANLLDEVPNANDLKNTNLSTTFKFLLQIDDNSYQLLDNCGKEIVRKGCNEYIDDAVRGSDENYEIFKTILTANNVLKYCMFEFLKEYVEYLGIGDHLLGRKNVTVNESTLPRITRRMIEMVNYTLIRTERSAYQLLQVMEYAHIAVKQYHDGPSMTHRLNLVTNIVKEILKYSTCNSSLKENFSKEIFFKYAPYYEQLSFDHVHSKFTDNAEFLEYNTLKKMCRDVLRRAIFEKYRQNTRQTKLSKKLIQGKFLDDINSLKVPPSIINYLRFIE